jgi:hypothetical protein
MVTTIYKVIETVGREPKGNERVWYELRGTLDGRTYYRSESREFVVAHQARLEDACRERMKRP